MEETRGAKQEISPFLVGHVGYARQVFRLGLCSASRSNFVHGVSEELIK